VILPRKCGLRPTSACRDGGNGNPLGAEEVAIDYLDRSADDETMWQVSPESAIAVVVAVSSIRRVSGFV
jgi:hypothetical protein